MKIIITGGKGFVGRAFYRLFEGKGHDITCIDIKDGLDCRDFFKTSKEKFDLVIHLAAIVGGRMKIDNDPISVATDLSIDAEMFNWAVRTNQPRVVYFSSSAAYPTKLQTGAEKLWEDDGRYRNNPKLFEGDIDLSDIKNPDMSYGWSKLTGEMLAEYARKQGVAVHVFRPFSGYGEDQDLDYPFPSFIKRIKDKVSEFEIWGDGNQVRDFIHIDDIVGATMEAVRRDIQEPINLGSGEATSFNELAEMMMKISGHKVHVKHILNNPVGVQYRVSDNTKMLSFYTPKISLANGIKKALDK